MSGVHICSFSTPIAELQSRRIKGRTYNERTSENVLKCLAQNPRVSSFEMCENYGWLPSLIQGLIDSGLVKEGEKLGFPWLQYPLTEAGRARLAEIEQAGTE